MYKTFDFSEIERWGRDLGTTPPQVIRLR